jgi:uncharacterized protein
VRLTPKTASARVLGLIADADGEVALKVAVTAAPERGRANEALLKLLAKALGLRRRDLSLAQGASDRRKLVHVAGDPEALTRQLQEALAAWPTPG